MYSVSELSPGGATVAVGGLSSTNQTLPGYSTQAWQGGGLPHLQEEHPSGTGAMAWG